MAQKRKLRLEIQQQSDENGEYGIPKVPRWFNQNATITTKENNQQNQINRLENRNLSNSMDTICDLNLECVKTELTEYEETSNTAGESSIPFEKALDKISEGYNNSEIEPLEVVDEFNAQMEKIKIEETTDTVGDYETVYINSSIQSGNNEISKFVYEKDVQKDLTPNSMIESKIIKSLSSLCRLCAIQRKDMIDIFQPNEAYDNIIEKIQDCLSILVNKNDILPQKVCRLCLEKLELFNKFRNAVAAAEEQFFILGGKLSEEWINDGEELINSGEECEEINPQSDEKSDTNVISAEELLADEEIPDTNEMLPLRLSESPKLNDNATKIDEKDNSDDDDNEDVVFVREGIMPHKQNLDYDIVKCRICGKLCGSVKTLYAHSNVHSKKDYYPCAMCNSFFSTKREGYVHSFVHTAGKVPPEIAAFYTNTKIPSYNLRSKSKRLSKMKKEKQTEVEKVPVIIIPYVDNTNDGIISDGENTVENETDFADQNYDDDDMIKCRICGKYFGTAKSCYLHSIIHVSGNQRPCSMCDKVLTNEDESIRHSHSEHIIYKRPQRRSELLKKVSEEMNPQSSSITFNNRFSNDLEKADEMNETDFNNLLRCVEEEVRNETSDQQQTDESDMIKCRICGLYFGTAKSCYLHSVIHVSGIQRPCSMCDKILTNEDESVRHSREHIIPKMPQKRAELFVRKVSEINLRSSPIINTKESSKSVEKINEKDETADDNFSCREKEVKSQISADETDEEDMMKCRICGLYFGTARSCYKHSKIHVSGTKRPCSMCDKVFTNENDSVKHSYEHIMPEKPEMRAEYIKKVSEMKPRSSAIVTNKRFSNRVKKIDERDETDDDNAPYCEEEGEVKNQDSDDRSNENDLIQCRICFVYFGTARSCYKHSKVHVSGNQYPCSMCDKILTNKDDSVRHGHEHIVYEMGKKIEEFAVRKVSKINLHSSPIMSNNESSNSVGKINEEDKTGNDNVSCSKEKGIKNQTSANETGEDDMIQCRICGLYFGTPRSCYKHSKVHVSGTKRPCSMCDKVFTDENDSVKHSYEHIMPEKPRMRAEYIKRLSESRQRSSPIITNKRFSNEVEKPDGKDNNDDNDSPRSKEQEVTAVQNVKNDMIKCLICGFYFGTARNCWKHSKVHIKGNQYPCSMCDKILTNEGDSIVHSFEHIDLSRRTSRKIKLNNKEEEDQNIIPIKIEKNEMIKCRICGTTNKNALESYAHSAIHVKKNYFPCTMCYKHFTKELEAYRHNLDHVMSKLGAKRPTLTHVCGSCGKRFASEKRLQFHEIYHNSTKRPCYCNICDKVMNSERSLYHHMTSIHDWPEDKEYNCRTCGKQFKSLTQLNGHQAVHSNRPYTCPSCGKKFVANEKLELHKIHCFHQSYTCHYCENKFSHKFHLIRHLKSHTNSQNRPHKCEHCPNTFISDQSRKEHEKSHSRYGTFKCSECGLGFFALIDLQNHQKSVHANSKPFNCTFCDESFKLDKQRHEHMKAVHFGDKRYQCDVCGKKFSEPSILIIHKKNLHR